jgi:hypothetical protein
MVNGKPWSPNSQISLSFSPFDPKWSSITIRRLLSYLFFTGCLFEWPLYLTFFVGHGQSWLCTRFHEYTFLDFQSAESPLSRPFFFLSQRWLLVGCHMIPCEPNDEIGDCFLIPSSRGPHLTYFVDHVKLTLASLSLFTFPRFPNLSLSLFSLVNVANQPKWNRQPTW